MKEKDLQCLFRNWLKANWRQSAAFELKICKTDRFNLKCIAEHQLANLELANRGLFFWKLADLGLQNAFDCFTLSQVPAYVVIFFYKPRQPKKFYMIKIDTILIAKRKGYKSITEKQAEYLAELTGELK
jgi:penicillin-binding protein-related factor A (putative recombinase)